MWRRDPELERQFDNLGMKWDYRTGVPISRIEVEKSKHNNARFGEAVNADRCLELAGFMADGAIFEAPVVAKSNIVDKKLRRDRLFILAGNHRINAAITCDLEAVSAYIITEASQEAMEEFTRTDNTKHGQMLTEEDRIEHIIEMSRKYGKSTIKLCQKFFGKRSNNVNSIIEERIRQKEVKEELMRYGLDPSRVKNNAVFKALHPLSSNNKSKFSNKNVLCKSFRNVVDCGLNGTQTMNMVAEVRRLKTEKEQMTYLTNFEKANSKRIPRSRRTDSSKEFTQFQRVVTSLHKMFVCGNHGKPFEDFKQFGDNIEDTKIDEVLTKLHEVGLAYKKIKGDRRIRRRK